MTSIYIIHFGQMITYISAKAGTGVARTQLANILRK